MIRNYLHSLFLNRQYLDLILIYVAYLTNFFIIFTFGSRIGRIKTSNKTIFITSFIFSLYTIFLKSIFSENLFSLTISILSLISFTIMMKPINLKIVWKSILRSAWIIIIINLIIAFVMCLVTEPLILILSKDFYKTTIGIIVGTICEFIGMLILLIIFPRKEGDGVET